ncbi:MAG: ornithine carbamoyltransferase [Clostridia bacterium]
MKHLIGIRHMSVQEMDGIFTLAGKLKKENRENIPHLFLKGKTLAMIFSKSSTRTRVSFETGFVQLGGHPIYMNERDIQLGRGETIYDTAKVLSRYVDGIVIRTSSHQDVEDLAKYGEIPVINALTDLFHPCQILSDLFTIREEFHTLKGLKTAYVGDGNNIANSLLFGCAKTGMDIAVATPAGYGCPKEILAEAQGFADVSGSRILMTSDPAEAVAHADVVYTDTWVSMGQESDKEKKLKAFEGYRVDSHLFSLARPSAIFLHCLPAYRGYEVTGDVIDGDRSRVFDQAENRLHVQKAVMLHLMGGE